jgi:hypothetical protein
MRCMVKVKKIYFKRKFSLYAYYLNFYAMTNFKIKLQLKFRQKKIYS